MSWQALSLERVFAYLCAHACAGGTLHHSAWPPRRPDRSVGDDHQWSFESPFLKARMQNFSAAVHLCRRNVTRQNGG